MSIKFVDPPPTSHRSGRDWRAIVSQLKGRPGQWALVAESVASATVTEIPRRYPGVECTSRVVSKSPLRVALYARWVGGVR